MNSVVLSGRIASDISFRITKKGIGVANFILAVPNRAKKKNEDGTIPTDFPKMVAWGKIAEICRDYLIKGREIIIHGSIGTERYEVNNQKIFNTFVTVNMVEFTSYYNQSDNNEENSEKTTTASENEGEPQSENLSFNNISDEELPF